jgi:hypothetical protein
MQFEKNQKFWLIQSLKKKCVSIAKKNGFSYEKKEPILGPQNLVIGAFWKQGHRKFRNFGRNAPFFGNFSAIFAIFGHFCVIFGHFCVIFGRFCVIFAVLGRIFPFFGSFYYANGNVAQPKCRRNVWFLIRIFYG